MDEVWREIPGWPGYDVSDQGRVRSWKKALPFGGSVVDMAKPPRILRGGSQKGYKKINLFDGAATGKTFRVNRLVLLTFLGPGPDGFAACHNDGCRTNNRLSNLRWGSSQENSDDKRRHGTHLPPPHYSGGNHPCAKLTWDQVAELRDLRAAGSRPMDLAAKFGINAETVRRIAKGQTYKPQDRVSQ